MVVVVGEFDHHDVAKLLMFSEMQNTLCVTMVRTYFLFSTRIVANAHLKP